VAPHRLEDAAHHDAIRKHVEIVVAGKEGSETKRNETKKGVGIDGRSLGNGTALAAWKSNPIELKSMSPDTVLLRCLPANRSI
jgi:hypothetical protein